MKKIVTVNASGQRVGESHPLAKLTNHEVELVRQLHESGMGYGRIAAAMETPKRTIRDIVTFRRRGPCPVRLKTVMDSAES